MTRKKKTVTVTNAQFLGLLYHDLFDYPLTEEELELWRVGNSSFPKRRIESTGPFLHPSGREATAVKRASKAKPSERKWEKAKRAAAVLSKIPTIKLIGISGALSMGNAAEEDDIDLFIITAVDTLWITRLFSYALLFVLRIPVRRSQDKEVKDKLCLNLWLDEKNLDFGNRRDIYTAHEVLQVKPLYDDGGVFVKFLGENEWVYEFFPGAQALASLQGKTTARQVARRILSATLRLLNPLAYRLQIAYMKAKKSREVAEGGRALFHKIPWESTIPEVFVKRLEGSSKKPRGTLPLQVSD